MSSTTEKISEDEIEKYILNENNKFITKKVIENILKKYDITLKIKNLEIFQKAMIHASYIKKELKSDRIVKLIQDKDKDLKKISEGVKAIELQDESYERLEFLGDSVIHLILAEYLFHRYPDEYEGFMTRLRTKIENSQTLSDLSKKIGLNDYAIIARYIEQVNGREKNVAIFEDVFEAFTGALYLESNYETCKKFITNIIEKEVDFSQLLYIETNHKDTLLQYYHKMKWPDPEYGLAESINIDVNKKTYKMYVKGFKTDAGGEQVWVPIGFGTGNSKKKGEQEAAHEALKFYGVINDESDDEEDGEYEMIE